MSPRLETGRGVSIRQSLAFGGHVVRVEGRAGENMEKLLRRFKKACEKEGLTKQLRQNQHFEKPSDKKRRKLVAACRAQRKELLSSLEGGRRR
jgi:small subunit ribosomal protein S21